MIKSYISDEATNPRTSVDKRFFQVSFFLPIVLPFVVIGLSRMFSMDRFLNSFGETLGVSLFFGGLPYIFFLSGLFVWMRGKDADEIRRMTYFAPLIFIPVLILADLIFGLVLTVMYGSRSGFIFVGYAAVFGILYTLVLGYAYVLVVNLIYHLLKALKS